jgi:hypothetical protein
MLLTSFLCQLDDQVRYGQTLNNHLAIKEKLRGLQQKHMAH